MYIPCVCAGGLYWLYALLLSETDRSASQHGTIDHLTI